MLKAAVLALAVVHTVAVEDLSQWRLFDVHPPSVEHALELRKLDIDGIDWQPICVDPDHKCQAVLPYAGVEKFVTYLELNQITYEEDSRSVQQIFEEERARIDRYNAQHAGSSFVRTSDMQQNPWDLEYHDYTDTADFVRKLVAGNPSVATLINAGNSHEGRPIVGLRIGLNASAPKIAFDGCIHAREWITTATVMYMVNQMIDGFNANDADIIALLNRVEFHIFPVVNPDGYQYTFGGAFNRFWRKTRKPNPGSSCIGTDPNRNADSNFGGPGTSSNPCSDSYHGPAPFSEPEVAGLRDYYSGLSDLRLYNNIHSVANLLLSPYGYTSELPADYNDHQTCHQRVATAIQAVNGNSFRFGPIWTAIYPASGGLIDWIYDETPVKYTAAWELGGGSFSPPASFIVTSGREIWAGMLAHVDCVLQLP